MSCQPQALVSEVPVRIIVLEAGTAEIGILADQRRCVGCAQP